MAELKEHEARLPLDTRGLASTTTPIITGYLESIFISQTMPARVTFTSTRTNTIILDGFFRLTENAYPRVKALHSNNKIIDHYATRHLLNESLQVVVRGARNQNTAFTLRWVTT